MRGPINGRADSVAPRNIDAEIESRAQALAQQIVADTAIQTATNNTAKVFERFNPSTDIVENQKTLVTAGLFSDASASISTVFTSSAQSSTSKQYYYNVYKDSATLTNSVSQFAISYGHKLGSGSYSEGQLNDSATKAVYSQYKQLLLNPGDTTFSFNNENSDSIYVINFNRDRLEDRLDPGNWQLSLATLSGSLTNSTNTGSAVRLLPIGVTASNKNFTGSIVTLIDDSGDTDQARGFRTAGRVYNIISGSITAGPYISASSYVYYGLAYPDMGMLILNANQLNSTLNFNTVTGSGFDGQNIEKFWISLSGSMSQNTSLYSFQGRNAKTTTSTHYFVRVMNNQFNFSNNPSFVTGSEGEFSQPTFVSDPKVYITTVGMYNDNQELLAIAKLSQPIKKSFQDEALIKVKLDF